ncbi:MAG: efflux RND transporter periplasmic adaptor subunit [bacterium]
MANKKIILAIIGLAIAGLVVWQVSAKKSEPNFILREARLGDITQTVSETGKVKSAENLNLNFKIAGRIEGVYFKVGDKVKEGEVLARLEASQLKIQLREAEALLGAAQAKSQRLLVGATSEEIQSAKTLVANAEISLQNARQNLRDSENTSQEDLKNSYEDALNTLDDSYLKIYNSFNVVDLIQRTYFSVSSQYGIRVIDNKNKIGKSMSEVKSYLDAAKYNPKNENIDIAISEMKKALDNTFVALGIIRETCEAPAYYFSAADKASLDACRTNTNTAQTNIVNDQQAISSAKIASEANTNTAQAKVLAAEGSLKTAQDDLSEILAVPRQVDIDLYQAEVKEAQARVDLLKDQLIDDVVLRAPAGGQVVAINKRAGEVVQPTPQDALITLLPVAPFEINVNIYEEDVVKMSIGNLVDISMAAFPDRVFKGKVISIDPAEQIIEEVVYYKITIGFDEGEMPTGIKTGMTADVVIKTAEEKGVLIAPKEAVQKIDGKKFIQVWQDGKVQDREIETSLEGRDSSGENVIEVVSGLQAGEKIIFK